MKKVILFLICFCFLPLAKQVWAFCGFYVAQADAKLFNESSQVILVKNGDKMTVTMANDFKGEVKDFAMVVPVPVVLQKDDIRVKENHLFDRFNAYSAPRLAEYYDENPCYDRRRYLMSESVSDVKTTTKPTAAAPAKKDLGVKIEAQYQVGEYDILILSAKESSGLETWLTQNGYKIPAGAQEVLQPYIKSNLKFFVVKVNLEKQAEMGYNYLRPIQITYKTNQFMLPIRLGMANSRGEQDLIIYTITQKGRTETTNYRTVEMPTNKDIPTFVRGIFGEFYKAVFQRKWLRENKSAVFVEYAWDIAMSNPTKCDPCAAPPLDQPDLVNAGVDWTQSEPNKLFFTRLHVRYDRQHFPQDLTFQETPNKERFQCRYVMHQPAVGGLDCEEGKKYKKTRLERQNKELDNLYDLTGWKRLDEYELYRSEIQGNIPVIENKSRLSPVKDPNPYRPSSSGTGFIIPQTNTSVVVTPNPDKSTQNQSATPKNPNPFRPNFSGNGEPTTMPLTSTTPPVVVSQAAFIQEEASSPVAPEGYKNMALVALLLAVGTVGFGIGKRRG